MGWFNRIKGVSIYYRKAYRHIETYDDTHNLTLLKFWSWLTQYIKSMVMPKFTYSHIIPVILSRHSQYDHINVSANDKHLRSVMYLSYMDHVIR